jgi:oligopeptide transport system permease protein
MLRYILVRSLQAIPVLLIVISITFVLIRAAPGGPFDSERAVAPEVLQKLNERYNLDQPLHTQLIDYLISAAQGDFGPSFRYPGRTVNELIYYI